ncbi:hypothetical protein [Geodermatophilus ruber]|uniref:Uncharacterized protein n=1 Tax=Geodermatophilus ruber TaxID=504800 RepID=A0A1I4JMH5_9ACTN|nr:hypothetical protein [Geodermatophilus ruber]SFL67749.1 hypothetical protein SAMN04488085_11562 [Geodermatophilus ruber]
MISTLPMFAPAGVSGPGRLPARPVACAAEQTVAQRLRALVAAPAGVSAIAFTGGRVGGTAVPAASRRGGALKRITPNHGTTLGIHSPGRPLS